MNFKQLEQYFVDHLQLLYGEDEAREIYFMVVARFTGWSRTQLLMNTEKEVLEVDYLRYHEVLDELAKGKPVQHVFEEAWFYSLKFKVSDAVLIPRPETEELVDWILKVVKDKPKTKLRILDIGTGSGCIAVTLKKEEVSLQKERTLEVDALDVSEEALTIARQNALLNGTHITFIYADILSYDSDSSYDIIVSNPPYIKEDEREAMHQNVLQYEPHLALFVSNENPLIFYKSIADFARIHLTNEGMLFFEINAHLGKETVEMLKDKGFVNIVLRQDMQGKDRMICCQYQKV